MYLRSSKKRWCDSLYIFPTALKRSIKATLVPNWIQFMWVLHQFKPLLNLSVFYEFMIDWRLQHPTVYPHEIFQNEVIWSMFNKLT